MHVPDPSKSRLVLIGTGTYADDALYDLPSVRRGTTALVDLLTQSRTGLFGPRDPVVLLDAEPRDMSRALDQASKQAEDTLVLYYAGHGLVDDRGELYLGARSTDPGLLATTALAFRVVRDVLAASRARYLLVILDCDFSGRAVGARTDDESALSGQLHVEGTYVLASSSGTQVSFVHEKDEYPAFTAELINLLRRGASDGPEFHTPESLFHSLTRAATSKGIPRPMRTVMGDVDLALARNIAYREPRTESLLPEAEAEAEAEAEVEAEAEAAPLPRWSVPGFAGETFAGPDLLGVEGDATALAVLLASRTLSPPLALGLFGNWGSGKTFFMHRLEEGIQKLTSEAGEDSAFCDQVVSVWFNAWHYAEANVWASLLQQIFGQLCRVKDAPERMLDEAMRQVRGVQETKAEALAESKAAQRTVVKAKAEVDRVEKEHQHALEEAAKPRVQDLLAADSKALTAFEKAAKAVGLGTFASGARGIAEAIRVSRELAENRGRFAVAGTWYRTPLLLGLGIAAVLGVAAFVVGSLMHWPSGWAATAVGLLSGAFAGQKRYTTLAGTLLQPAQELIKEADARRDTLLAEQQAKEQTVRDSLRLANASLALAKEALASAKERMREAVDALDQLTGERLLERYLAERVADAEYDRYLGVVALAHRDLRDLEAFLRKYKEDGGAGIDRIVLYIDDLDRCPPKVVATVLEAVHLLLALPLFVVVVGVDARWLSRSLLDQHPLLLSGDDTAEPNAPRSHANPGDYLDKIFQLSYSLPPMTRKNSVDLLTHSALAGQRRADEGSADLEATVSATADGFVTPSAESATDAAPQPGIPESVPLARDIGEAAAEALVLGSDELRLLEAVAPVVGSSPRIAKRFLNVYRVMKARIVTDRELQDRLGPSGDVSLMVLTALIVGFPVAVPNALAVAPHELPVRDWLNTGVRPALSGAEAARLSEFMDTAQELDGLTVGALWSWLPLVRRYAWPVAAADA
ncbi:P-loop NTPase fold protein [Streptomyces sp. R21]|uniref:P-loop NTPase fold protein n=1 Tax=Streptomyces sp. R21 TaxID=3238627 RepID=A0AB39PHZ7_9ACTN